MREQTNLNGVKAVAKSLLMLDIHLTDYSPVIVQHPFTSSGMVATPTENGLTLLDITEGDENLNAWRGLMVKQIDQAKNAYHIYMMLNKPYALAFLSLSKQHLSQKDFSEILADAWIRSENPNMDKNFAKNNLVVMFKKADKTILMDGEEKEIFDSFDDKVTIYRGVTSYNANTAEQSMASVMSTALSRLNTFLDSELEQLLCFDTEIDAEKFCSEKSAIFVIMPEENPNTFFIISLVIQQLYREILSVADEHGGKLKNRCVFFCDEFGTLPKIESAEIRGNQGGQSGDGSMIDYIF